MPELTPTPGRRRYRSATVHGNRADAERALAVLVADVRSTKTIGAQSTLTSRIFDVAGLQNS